MNIIEAMRDPRLFGGNFEGDSWSAWKALLSGFYGLPHFVGDGDAWKALTGLQPPPPGFCESARRELWLAVGRRGGKSQIAALIAAFEAAFVDHTDKLAPGEVATVMLIAGDRLQARTLLRYVQGLFENPMLRKMVIRETANGLDLSNRCSIEVQAASFRSVRGYTVAAAILDEVAFWRSEGANPDAETVAALRPALATLDGKLIALSSPYARRGALWDQYAKHFGNAGGDVLVAQAPSRVMNPTLPQSLIDKAMADDPARARAEYLAEFRSDIEQFIDLDLIAEATRLGRVDLPPVPGAMYQGFVDAAGGGKDEFTLAIGHKDEGRIIVDLVTGRRGNPAAITAGYAETLKSYRIKTVRGDRYAGEWVSAEFKRHGIVYEPAGRSRSELYLDFLPALTAGTVELPPCDKLSKQFVGLERRTSRTGRDIIDHAPGAHDDRANACAGLVALAIRKTVMPSIRSLGGELWQPGRLSRPNHNCHRHWL